MVVACSSWKGHAVREGHHGPVMALAVPVTQFCGTLEQSALSHHESWTLLYGDAAQLRGGKITLVWLLLGSLGPRNLIMLGN